MTAAEIQNYRTTNPGRLHTEFHSAGSLTLIGEFLDAENDNEGLKKINRYKIIENLNADKYLESNSMEYLTVIDGNLLINLVASY